MKSKNISSLNNKKIMHLLKLKNSREYRKITQTALVMGKKFIEDISKLYPPLLIIEANETSSLPCEQKFSVSSEVLSKIAGVSLSKGSIAEIPIPASTPCTQLDKLLVLDRIKDPGNLGTIVRSALAFGWNHLFFLPGSCDLFNDKVIRASAGSCFFVKREEGDFKRLQELQKKLKLQPFIADTKGVNVEEIECLRPLLIISNESFGPTEEIRAFGKAITIPTKSVESLNAATAAGILLYLL